MLYTARSGYCLAHNTVAHLSRFLYDLVLSALVCINHETIYDIIQCFQEILEFFLCFDMNTEMTIIGESGKKGYWYYKCI